jgi:hypothetical protein
MKLRSVVKLGGATTDAGLYQFAIISDDGSALDIETSRDVRGNAVLTRIIDNNRNTASRFEVSDRALALDATKKLTIELQYFQGPKYHIAFQLLWRKVATSGAVDLREPFDGLSGVSIFFNSTSTPSVPTQKYLDLLSRGWRVLQPENFELPSDNASNPCSTP